MMGEGAVSCGLLSCWNWDGARRYHIMACWPERKKCKIGLPAMPWLLAIKLSRAVWEFNLAISFSKSVMGAWLQFTMWAGERFQVTFAARVFFSLDFFILHSINREANDVLMKRKRSWIKSDTQTIGMKLKVDQSVPSTNRSRRQMGS